MKWKLIRDVPGRYGFVARLFHWGMAYLLIWQFLTLIGWGVLGDGPFMQAVSLFGPAHGTVGLFVFILVFLRLAWTLSNRQTRPVDPGALGRLARATHGIFYFLMIIVPGLALIRSYGNGKGFQLGALAIIPKTGEKIDWLMAPANLLHGPLAWTLAVLIAGHIGMALFHGIVLRDGLLRRMAG